MAEPVLPETAAPASAAEIGLSAREADHALTQATPAPPRDAGSWAAKVDRLEVGQRAGVRGTNVAGRRLTGPVQGFGKMWQKTYRMDAGQAVSPQDAIATWRAHFPEFWPTGNKFSGALTGINPGDVALLDLAVGGGVKLSTGVFVLYADAESFTLMTPQGHMFAGWITFSAEAAADGTIVQAQVLMRANDPMYEVAMTLGGHRKEDVFWVATLTALGRRLGIASPAVSARTTCVDPRRQWKHAGNVWHNSMIRSVFQTAAAPFAAIGRRLSGGQDSGRPTTPA